MRFTHRTLIAGAAALGWLVAAAAWSQETETPPAGGQSESASDTLGEPAPATAPPGATSAAEIDDQKLDQFADAYLAVQTIQQKAVADMESAQDPAAAEKVRAGAESDMIAAVERSGLQVDEFNRIVETMAADVEVRNRVAAKLQERSGG